MQATCLTGGYLLSSCAPASCTNTRSVRMQPHPRVHARPCASGYDLEPVLWQAFLAPDPGHPQRRHLRPFGRPLHHHFPCHQPPRAAGRLRGCARWGRAAGDADRLRARPPPGRWCRSASAHRSTRPRTTRLRSAAAALSFAAPPSARRREGDAPACAAGRRGHATIARPKRAARREHAPPRPRLRREWSLVPHQSANRRADCEPGSERSGGRERLPEERALQASAESYPGDVSRARLGRTPQPQIAFAQRSAAAIGPYVMDVRSGAPSLARARPPITPLEVRREHELL
jgi:hypothetical protein